jgi:5-formyltetrahydrofolate cyclo-ligase
MQKKEARIFYKEKRKNIAAPQRRKWDDLILIQFQKLSLPSLECVLSFLPIETQQEVATTGITRYLQFLHPSLQMAYPVSDFTTDTMNAMIVNDETEFALNAYNIPEPQNGFFVAPSEIDLILVPLLCFDKSGYRVGYGKGFYDKFFMNVKKSAIKIGLSYFEPIEKIEDCDSFDIKLNYCITPQKIYEF